MTRFAVYFIPAPGKFYEAGSSLVGYDIRSQQSVAQPSFTKPAWAPEQGQFGFHMTITDAIEIDDELIDEIPSRVSDLLKCFRPDNQYILEADRIGFWRDASNTAIMVMKPNRNVEMLHDVLVASLHPLGKGSEYTKRYAADPNAFVPNTPTDIQRLNVFFGPFIFDDFVPHFTCIESFTGTTEERPVIESQLRELLVGTDRLTIDKLALLVQRDGEDHFSILKEFSLHGDQ
jgi:hypothetical protein